jgi:hypothetical protein
LLSPVCKARVVGPLLHLLHVERVPDDDNGDDDNMDEVYLINYKQKVLKSL